MIAHNPLHGSGRAELPHPALALGNDAHAAQGIGMPNFSGACTNPSPNRASGCKRWCVGTSGIHRVQLRLQPFADRLPQHRVHSVAPLLHADMREAEKVECLGLPFFTPSPVLDRKRTKFQQPRFLGMQCQVELPHSFGEFRPELFGIRFANVLTRLNTRPARSPVNASTLPLRAAPHDLGSMWVATSHSCDFCIHYTSPV